MSKEIKQTIPSRFKNGSIEFHMYKKLREYIQDIREVQAADMLLLEQAAKLYGLVRSLEVDIEETGNYITVKYDNGKEEIRKNPVLSDYKALQASYIAVLRDLGIAYKDRSGLLKNDTSFDKDY